MAVADARTIRMISFSAACTLTAALVYARPYGVRINVIALFPEQLSFPHTPTTVHIEINSIYLFVCIFFLLIRAFAALCIAV